MSTSKPQKSSRQQQVLDRLVETLTQPRPLTPQVSQYLLAHHEVLAGEIAEWMRKSIGSLESYELELLLSPLFTPDLDAHVQLEEALGKGVLAASEVEDIVGELAAKDLQVALLLDDDTVSASVPEEIIERYVRLLHLAAPLPVDSFPRAAQLRPEVRWYLRDPTWQRRQSRELLPTLLGAAERVGSDFEDYIRFLTEFVRSHRPSNQQDCAQYLASLAQAHEDDLRKHETGARSFFNDELKATYAGTRQVSEDVVLSHRRAISMARALQTMLS